MTQILLAVFFAAENAADAWTTWQTLRFGGVEENEAILWLIKRVHLYWALVIFKVGTVAVLWSFIAVDSLSIPELVALDVLYAWVVAHNWHSLQSQKAIANRG